ncbi:MAG: DUF2461 domain-containing protein [Pseudomonadota bacterium]
MAFTFSPRLIKFLRALERNNEREWFADNKARYEAEVREPALDFIEAMAEPLQKVSTHFVAMPKKTGGSLMRPYRDTRFSKDKTPYKTNVGIQFRHELARDVHSPGYYFHIAPREVFIGVGMWRPEPKALAAIRERIVSHPDEWKKVGRSRNFAKHFELAGESLVRQPRGFDAENPLISDIKRKDFIGVKTLEADDLYTDSLIKDTTAVFKAASPLMQFLCKAVGISY